MFGFTGTLATLAAALSSPNAKIPRWSVLVMPLILIGLASTYWISVFGPSRLHDFRQSAGRLAQGYKIIRNSVDSMRLKAISFVFQHEPVGFFYFFSDENHTFIDPTLPSFIFRRPLEISLAESRQGKPADEPDKLIAVWSDDLQLKELRFGANAIYRNRNAMDRLPPYRPGETINFEKGGNSKAYVGSGWSSEDELGTWSDGSEAAVRFKFDRTYNTPMELVVQALPFVPGERPEQRVAVLANDQQIANWTFRNGDSRTELRAEIPANVVRSDDLKLVFRITDPVSPKSLGLSDDARNLGLMVQKLRITLSP
jgi:hypothetical protein